MTLAVNDADPAVSYTADLRALAQRLVLELEDLDAHPQISERSAVTINIVSDPDYTLLAELQIADIVVAVIPVYNFDDYEMITP